MSKRGDVEFLADIKEAIRRINFYTKHLDFAAFLDDLKTQDAVVRNLEVIGEATKNLSEQLHHEAPERELYILHTSRETLDITERRWLGIRGGVS